MFLTTGMTLLIPQFIRWIVDRVIYDQNARLLGFSVMGLLALTIVKGFFTYFRERWTEIAA